MSTAPTPDPATRFALYARTSTDDQQSPEDSLAWQRSRAEALIAGHGRIVATFHDIGRSRSLPWSRRPEATALLAEARRPDRRFDAVVVAEPARAFYGGQFATVFPVLDHYGCDLWVPEVGGRVDPGSEAHDMVMMLFGGMSKGERNRIKMRVRTAMAEQATHGRFLGGRPPYGYTLADAGPHPNPGKSKQGLRLHRLVPDPVAAPIVERIFRMYVVEKLGPIRIARQLTDEGIPSPSGHDPGRNPHRSDARGAWSTSAVRTILRNPRYLGRETWAKYSGHDVLVDPDDVALGHRKAMRPNSVDRWVLSDDLVHDPIIDPELFAAAQERIAAGRRRDTVRKMPTTRPYVLRGLVRCGTCGRSMGGCWRHGRPYYLCRLSDPAAYARSEALEAEHPRTAYLREDRVLPPIERWLATLFDPAHVDTTVAALAQAAENDPALDARAAAARKRLTDAETKLGRLRTALENGTADPALIGPWLTDADQERAAAEIDLQALDATARPDMSPEALRTLLHDLRTDYGDMAEVLAAAEPADKAALLSTLGVRVDWLPSTDRARVSVHYGPSVRGRACRRGDLNPEYTEDSTLRGVFSLAST